MFSWLERYGYVALLASLSGLFVLSPLIHDEYYGIVFETYVFCVVLLFCVFSLNPRRWVKYLAFGTAGTTSVMWYLSHLYNNPLFNTTSFHLLVDFMAVFFLFIVSALILKDVLLAKEVNPNLLCGSVCLYLLIGLLFSVNYHAAILIDQNALQSTIPGLVIDKNVDLHSEGLSIRYFSFVTLSTLGFGDIVPGNNLTRTMAWIESVFGQIYLTILVARLVGLHIAVDTAKSSPNS